MTPRSLETVLIVEDDASTRNLFRSAFKAAGYSVVAVEDGADALRFVDQQVPSAVVLDLSLPRVPGRDVLRDLRTRPQTIHTPIVVVSGVDTSDINPSSVAAVMAKPVHPEVIVWEVEKSIERVRRQHPAL